MPHVKGVVQRAYLILALALTIAALAQVWLKCSREPVQRGAADLDYGKELAIGKQTHNSSSSAVPTMRFVPPMTQCKSS
jgi:hypothetical protein